MLVSEGSMNVSSAAYENNGQPVASAPAPIVAIRQALIAADDRRERVWKRQVPAWMISGGIHMVLMALFLVYAYFTPTGMSAAGPENQILETRVEDAAQAKQNFENTDV